MKLRKVITLTSAGRKPPLWPHAVSKDILPNLNLKKWIGCFLIFDVPALALAVHCD
jgi:hypothetical protein